MTQTTQSLREFSATTESFDDKQAALYVVGSYAVASTTANTGLCEIVVLDHNGPRQEVLPNHISIDDLESRLFEIPGMAEQLANARPWVAETIYPNRIGLRTLRLSRGLTQSALATMIGTSQPHVARMEQGNGDIMRDTMRRLCIALEVDMNTLDGALQMPAEASEDS